VDSPGQSAFVLTWITGTLSFTLTTPNAIPVTPAIAIADPNITYTSSSAADRWTSSAAYIFTETLTGTWALTIGGVDTGGVEVPFAARALLSSTLQLVLPEYAVSYQMRDTLPITATLSDNGVSLAEATLTATLWRPDGEADTLTLFDDGAHHDGAVGDGIYGEMYTIPGVYGYYMVRVTALGTQGGTPFSREAQGMFMVAADTATLANSYTDYVVDIDGNGFYESLALDIGIQATQAGTYTLAAWLVGAGQIRIAQATRYAALTAGTQIATLQFDGDLIHSGGLDGPYGVTEVYLVDSSGAQVLTDKGTDVWVTQAYDHRRFGTPYEVFLPLVLRSW
jgi:hypothetical protein